MSNIASPFPSPTLCELFANDGARLEAFAHEVAGMRFDWSKTHLDKDRVVQMVERLSAAGFQDHRAALFAGEIVNSSEHRPALHAAERGSGAKGPAEAAAHRHARVRALIDAVEAGVFGDITGILHIGIGGSLLGPHLLVDALGRRSASFTARFVGNIDGAAFDSAIADLDPETTLVVAASKTFTTAETLANLDSARDWLRAGGVEDPDGRVIAITGSPHAALDAGIDETRVLTFDAGVGGRYSLWSAIGFTAALALGWAAFEELLEGASLMDSHFAEAPLDANMPVLAAFADRFYVEEVGAQTRAVFAYDERLAMLSPYLQQLEMESNGKGVTADGLPLAHPSAPVTWGGVGTDAQHAVFQLLHQGTVPVPVEFIAVAQGDDDQDEARHELLLLNCFAQGAALMTGRSNDDPQRAYSGNRPSATILLERLDPRTLGALIAFYEHRTFANAVLIGNNPFDQFGVELGKEIARKLADGEVGDLDPSTRALIEKAGF